MVPPTSLNQAFYDGVKDYVYGLSPAIPNMPITGAPADTDRTRWGMLQDSSDYRLYFFKGGSNDTLYQFVFNATTSAYEYVPDPQQLKITGAAGAGIPSDADPRSFSMLYDRGSATYRLYMRSKSDPKRLLQFSWTGTAYEYGHDSIPGLRITGGPADTDYDRWAMLHDGERYCYYALKRGASTTLYQFAYNPESGDYEYGYDSIPELGINSFPTNSDTSSFEMVYSGSYYSLYFQTKAAPPAPIQDDGPIFPVDLSGATWCASTYPDHGGAQGGYQYSAVDISIPGVNTRGQAVSAIEGGVVDEARNGWVAIRHTAPLKLKNGAQIPAPWYSGYGHLETASSIKRGIPVKRGTPLGVVSSVDVPHPYEDFNHLHFLIFRRWNPSTRTDAISPYWLPGEYSNNPLLYSDDGKGSRSASAEEPAYYVERILSSAPTQ